MRSKSIASTAVLCAIAVLLIAYWYLGRNDGSNPDYSYLSSKPPVYNFPIDDSRPAAFQISDRVAVIAETRPIRSLIPLILHFASVLGPSWPIIFLTRPSALHDLHIYGGGSAPFKDMIARGRVKVMDLPSDQSLWDYHGISHFLASPWFWSLLSPAKHMLLFQTDSIICANSGKRVEDFFEYDFIGAAHPFVPDAFNGGFSLRNVTLSQLVVNKYNIADDIDTATGEGLGLYEDAWFCEKMKEFGANFPTRDVAHEFVLDFESRPRPLGYHGINKGPNIERMEDIYSWCPEAFLASGHPVINMTQEEEAEKNATMRLDPQTRGGHVLPFD